MARVCDVCGKGPSMGHSIETRGKTRRQFRPNLQKIRVALPGGGAKSKRVCTQCIRSGAVRKAVQNKPFALPKS
ncbi:UNVERIFIED_CONTAM: hypothetical protein GTU68_042460 [Idotea baltica]|nr:hypothetical protein [Idotea baltica]